MAAVELENLCKKFTFSQGWGFNRTRIEIVAVLVSAFLIVRRSPLSAAIVRVGLR
ncbi:hypothetical protein [Dendronalium phyllosphericum]|uniref:hypothetical protein n=1 Tax=Dendronalium phyllosphericum TaxID=2840445 RepID=UPI0021F1B795|nr:hypothetical protein [Dendronalium phyllosphericum]